MKKAPGAFWKTKGRLAIIVALIGALGLVVSSIASRRDTESTRNLPGSVVPISGVANTGSSNAPALSISGSPGAAIHYNAPSDEQLKHIVERVVADTQKPAHSESRASSAGQVQGAKRFVAHNVTAELIHQAYLRDERIEDQYLDHWIAPPGWSGVVWWHAKRSDGRWYFVFREEPMSVAIHVWAGEEVAQLVGGDRVTVHGRIKDVRTGIVVLDDTVTLRKR